MPYADPAKKAENSRRRYAENPDYFKKKARKWKEQNPRRKAFLDQRCRARDRGVEWQITFKEWVEWWGNDIDARGRRRNDLCMCRYDDKGPYKIGNIYKATMEENDQGPRPFPVCPF